MTKRSATLLWAILIATMLMAKNVTGKVTCDGQGVSGVVVSDGFNVTTTDNEGNYALNSNKRNGSVFVSIPRGYEAPAKGGVAPQFWQPFSNNDPNHNETINFTLNRVDNDNFCLIVSADPQLGDREDDRAMYKKGFISRMKEEVKCGLPCYNIVLGDLSWDNYWFSNNYTIRNFLADQKKMGMPMPVFGVMGNHDNNPSTLYSDSTDFEASGTWRSVMGPRYFSFNIGKVHFVMLDNIVYKNSPLPKKAHPRKGVVGKRDYDDRVTDEQIEWLKKDLQHVDKNAPIVVCQHIPVFRLDAKFHTWGSLDNYKELADCFNQFTDVHFMSGHTHINYFAHPKDYPNIMEHNLASVGGTLWNTASLSGTNVCQDGSPAGYSRWIVNGDKLSWKWCSTEDHSDPQFDVWDLNEVKKFLRTDEDAVAMCQNFSFVPQFDEFDKNTILINVFAYDTDWKIEVIEENSQSGDRTLRVKRVRTVSPNYLLVYALPQSKKGTVREDHVRANKIRPFTHMFMAKAKKAKSTITVRITDSFGNTYEKKLQRPAPFTL